MERKFIKHRDTENTEENTEKYSLRWLAGGTPKQVWGWHIKIFFLCVLCDSVFQSFFLFGSGYARLMLSRHYFLCVLTCDKITTDEQPGRSCRCIH